MGRKIKIDRATAMLGLPTIAELVVGGYFAAHRDQPP